LASSEAGVSRKGASRSSTLSQRSRASSLASGIIKNSTLSKNRFSSRNMPRRLALLLLAAAACIPGRSALAQSPAPEAAQEEKAPTTLDAERIRGVGDLEFSAQGAAELTQDELRVFGESLRYNQEFGRLE